MGAKRVLVVHSSVSIPNQYSIVLKGSKEIVTRVAFCIDAYVYCTRPKSGITYDPVGFRCDVAGCTIHGKLAEVAVEADREFLLEN